ncbi:C-type lectin domain family member a isoform 1 precursor [Haloferula helveola]|uniref:C-type lectin domain family member a isoform 1 n=1 Tax=Haloferula helveola TaxID=490095 RepID=A0ABM7RCF1_9BACT|nr:C-type lectin domain family member a isoform 1 precursor [Haloferula helveola]
MSEETFQAPELEQLAQLLPNFDFQAFIAKGGMGAVYKARQKSLDRDVAIKILPRELGEDPEFRKSFETEAKAMAKLNDPNLIGVYDFGDVDGMPYIVMEYVDGKSLYYSAYNKVIEPAQAVQIITGICRGLGHAHENGIIHRDIKPANILLTPKAEPKIGDFGLARPVDHDGPGLIMGTPGYTAPEVIEDHEEADKQADIYGVGVILHELLTGQRPDPEGKKPRKSTGSPKLDAICKKATQTNPSLRYSTCEEMAADLKAWSDSPAARAPGKLLTTGGAAAGGAKPPGAGPNSPSPQPVAMSTGSSWSIVRNLLIIAVLLVAIAFTWKALKAAREKKDIENARIQKENFEAKERARAERERAAEEARIAAERERERQPVIPDMPEPKEETPMESLERLQRDLSRGGRAEMPIGTVRHGESDFFLVPDEMSWHRAAAFAEEHGGHLAVIHSEDDTTWLSQFLPKDTVSWVGAGRSLGDQWVVIDGTDLELEKNPSGVGNYATLDNLGLLRARRASDEFPFVIEWRRDGSNPATLAAMLRRTRETLEKPNPVFPPGTDSLDARHFAIIPRPVDRIEAEQLAELAGGILAVPASREEAEWLSDRCEKLVAEDGFWLGGTRDGKVWKWDSGEKWAFALWNDDADVSGGGEGLVLVPKSGWHDADPDDKMSGLIIEWSSDAEGAEANPDEIASTHTGSGTGELKKKAAELVEQAIQERDDKLAANVRTFNWDLDVWYRGLNPKDSVRWEPHVKGLKAMVEGNRVPAPSAFADEGEVALSEQMAKVCTFCYNKQVEIEAAHSSKLRRLRDAYVQRLREEGKKAMDSGQRGVADAISEEIENAEDHEDWAAELAD